MSYTEPLLSGFLLVGLLGIALRRRNGFRLCQLALIGLLMVSLPIIDWVASRLLEASYKVQPFRPTPIEAIVVLSSAIHKPLYERPFPVPDGETYERCEYVAWMHRQMPDIPVLACGGSPDLGDTPYSETMRQLLIREGVPEALIWIENRSRSTHESAVFRAEMLRSHHIWKIALVVNANSMPRARASFKKQGLTVVPVPSSYRQRMSWPDELLPSWGAIRRNELTLHELVGLAWYRLHGWI